jgi:hypothetical protein
VPGNGVYTELLGEEKLFHFFSILAPYMSRKLLRMIPALKIMNRSVRFQTKKAHELDCVFYTEHNYLLI